MPVNHGLCKHSNGGAVTPTLLPALFRNLYENDWYILTHSIILLIGASIFKGSFNKIVIFPPSTMHH